MNNIHVYVAGSKNFSNLLNELDFNYKISADKNIKYENKDLFVRVIFVENLSLIEIKKFFFGEFSNHFFYTQQRLLKKK